MELNAVKTGTVVRHTGSHYMVSALPEWNLVLCTLRGKLRLKESGITNPVAVGDRVEYMPEREGTGIIVNVLPRKNYIIRKSTNLSRQSHILAANIDYVFLIVTMAFPKVKAEFIDRFLITCEAYSIPARIVINKSDIYGEVELSEVERFKNIYAKSAGYPILEVSALTGEGVEVLREACDGAVSLFAGVSGVGKSSLINALDPHLELRTGEISEYHKQGKHTTTSYDIYPLSSGGFIVDMPGIKGFGLIEMDKDELSHYFPEMLRLLDGCRFAPCTHTHEPECAVKEGIETGLVSEERYASYLSMLEDEGKYR